MPTVNKELLPFKIVYFLKNAGMAVLPFLAPIANQRGISPEGVGLIWTMNPIVSSGFNVLCGLCADKWKKHRVILTALSGILGLVTIAYFFLPSVPPLPQALIQTKVMAHFPCVDNNSSLLICPSHNEKITSDWENTQSCDLQNPYAVQSHNDICKFECVSNDIQEAKAEDFAFNLSNYSLCRNQICYNMNHFNTSSLYWLSHKQHNCGDMNHSFQCKMTCKPNETDDVLPLSYQLTTIEFWLTAFCCMAVFVTLESANSLTDSMCFVVLGANGHRYGQTRLFGALAWGLMGAAMGIITDLSTEDGGETNYTPAIIMSACFLFLNLIFSSRLDIEVPGKISGKSARSVLTSFKCITLLSTAFVMGVTMSIIWSFEFIYIGTVAFEWDKNFSQLNIIYGLTVFTDCFIGEAPFLFLTSYIIKRLTHVYTFTVTLTATVIRVLLYGLISNPWLFIGAHLLHGISFGVFLGNTIAYAGNLAPEGAQATMQSTVIGFFIIGKALGASVGGILLQNIGGSKTYLVLSLTIFIYTIIYTAVNFLHKKSKGDGRGEYKNPTENQDKEATHKTQGSIN